jgi:hypothetical protein
MARNDDAANAPSGEVAMVARKTLPRKLPKLTFSGVKTASTAFSSEVDTGSREENASR